MKTKKFFMICLEIITSMFFVACAFDLAHLKYTAVTLTECTDECPSFTLKEELILNNLPCGYNRKLKENSEWKKVGTTEFGDVYKPLNQCLTLECSNVFEAYLVLNKNNIIGFYLPVEDGYVALKNPIRITKK